ncbi:MAG: nitroreductase family protein [Acidimicrobiia bacterium]|nr:nitroreductase family protein [Acidimicrobiia bacterium]
MTTTLGLSADEVLLTTRAVRRRLDFDRPVPESLLRECARFAVQAPTSSNGQGWHFVFVTERSKIEALAAIYRRGSDLNRARFIENSKARAATDAVWGGQLARMIEAGAHLVENLHRIPAMLIPCAAGRPEDPRHVVEGAGSVIQAAWSFMLAARARGLGTCWTTIHLMWEEEVAEILGIPYREVRQYAMIPVAYTIGTEFKPAARDLDGVLSFNGWSRSAPLVPTLGGLYEPS